MSMINFVASVVRDFVCKSALPHNVCNRGTASVVHRFVYRSALVLMGTVLLLGCSAPNSAVILWPDSDSMLKSGEVVTVTNTDVRNEVTVVTADGHKYRIAAWQIAQFDSDDALNEFLGRYTKYQYVFAQSEKKALPLRQDADRFSKLLYRFDRGEIIKVIDRLDTVSDEGGLVDYWYRVLTSSGEWGWVFGYYLSVINIQENLISSGQEADNNVAIFLNNIWRPAYFTHMFDTNSFDLETFNTNFGLFPAPLERNITINLPDFYLSMQYQNPSLESAYVFYFGENNEMKITLHNDEHISAEIIDGSNTRSFEFHLFEENIQQIINAVRAESRANTFN